MFRDLSTDTDRILTLRNVTANIHTITMHKILYLSIDAILRYWIKSGKETWIITVVKWQFSRIFANFILTFHSFYYLTYFPINVNNNLNYSNFSYKILCH